MSKTDRELRNLLESTQAEVKRLKSELASREKSTEVAAEQALAKEVQELTERLAELERENASLRATRGTEAAQEVAALEAEVAKAHREAALAREEVKQLRKQLEGTTRALEKAEAKVQKLSNSSRPASGGLLERLRGFFDKESKAELEKARKEISRLHQQLSLVQVSRRRGR
jgi:chromosome segregation ATPase